MSRLRMNWITVPALQLLLSLHAEPLFLFAFCPAMPCVGAGPRQGAGLRKMFAAPSLPAHTCDHFAST